MNLDLSLIEFPRLNNPNEIEGTVGAHRTPSTSTARHTVIVRRLLRGWTVHLEVIINGTRWHSAPATKHDMKQYDELLNHAQCRAMAGQLEANEHANEIGHEMLLLAE